MTDSELLRAPNENLYRVTGRDDRMVAVTLLCGLGTKINVPKAEIGGGWTQVRP